MVNQESAATALAHLEMICQAAGGDYSLKQGELEKRRAAVVAFITTGQCIAGESERELAAKVNVTVSSHLNGKPDAAQSDAA